MANESVYCWDPRGFGRKNPGGDWQGVQLKVHQNVFEKHIGLFSDFFREHSNPTTKKNKTHTHN